MSNSIKKHLSSELNNLSVSIFLVYFFYLLLQEQRKTTLRAMRTCHFKVQNICIAYRSFNFESSGYKFLMVCDSSTIADDI